MFAEETFNDMNTLHLLMEQLLLGCLNHSQIGNHVPRFAVFDRFANILDSELIRCGNSLPRFPPRSEASSTANRDSNRNRTLQSDGANANAKWALTRAPPLMWSIRATDCRMAFRTLMTASALIVIVYPTAF